MNINLINMNLDSNNGEVWLGAGSCTLYRSCPISELGNILYESHKTILITSYNKPVIIHHSSQ